MFPSRYGVIPACDVDSVPALSRIVKATGDLSFIQGYKIGMDLVVRCGVGEVVDAIRRFTDLPVIYDHQKFGTDIPEICGGRILEILRDVGISAVIIFPQAGIETLEAAVRACERLGLVPIVGGEMTHKGYLVQEGGYITDDAPQRMYLDAAELGVEYFVLPGTRVESIKRYRSQLEKVVESPKFLFPGIGKGQGGDIVAAFRAVGPLGGYAIVGRGIYAEEDSRQAAIRLWDNVRAEVRVE